MLNTTHKTLANINEALTYYKDHFRRQNFIAWNRFVSKDFREGLLPFNNYPFFAASFSWLSPMLRWEKEQKKPKPTPVVFHVSSANCRLWDVDGFITRMTP